MFYTKKKRINEQCDIIRCTRNKKIVHRMSLNDRISWVMGISIFGFMTYRKQVFALMEIQTTPIFEQFLKAETLNSENSKS